MLGVRYLYIDKKGNIKETEKYFKTERAIMKHLQKLEDEGTLYKILAYNKDN